MGNLCMGVKSPELVEDGRFVVHFVGATDVPKADIASESDPYIVAYIVEGPGKSKPYKSLRKDDCPNPIWNSYHDFKISFRVGAFLRVEIWDYDASSSDDLIGDVMIPLERLQDEAVKTFPVSYKIGNKEKNPNFSLTLQRVFMNAPPVSKKTIFLLRHGESKWNLAQAERDLLNMLDCDHCLSLDGIKQAESLNQCWKAAQQSDVSQVTSPPKSTSVKRVTFSIPGETGLAMVGGQDSPSVVLPAVRPVNFEELMLSCNHVYSSPLSRALQTAYVALQGHPAMSNGITLCSVVREFKKTIGGLDCVGEKVGEAIVSKVRSEFAGAIGSQRADDLVDNVPVDIADCGTPWWTSQYESPKEQQHRLKEFLEFVHHNGHDTAIYVGHSHFYKDLCASIIGSKLPIIKPDIAIKLSKYKLSNASMLGLTIVFPHDSDVPYIEDASLLFGGDFVSGDDAGGPTVDIENRL